MSSSSTLLGHLPEANDEIMAFLVNLNAPLKPTIPLLPPLLSLLLLLLLSLPLPATTSLDIATAAAELKEADRRISFKIHVCIDVFVVFPHLSERTI